MIVYFEVATGRIVKTVRSAGAVGTVHTPPEGLAQLDAPDVAKPFEFYVKNETMLPYPPSPGDWAAFNYDTQEWFDPRTVDDIYDEAQAYVRAFRDAVNVKRLKVITAGTDVDLTGYGIVALQGRPEDQTSLQGLAFRAQLRINAGDSTTLIDFMDRNNVSHQLTPAQMLELWQKGAAFISAIYARSWEIKEMNPETTDPDDNALWELGP